VLARRLDALAWWRQALTAVNAAAVALMGVAAMRLGLPLRHDLPMVAIFATAALMLFVTRVPSTIVMLTGVAIGLILSFSR
jgi:chromate transport protein ChrA